MCVPHISSFFWCMGLEIGSKCVGYTHLLVSLTIMILSSVFAENTRGFIGTVMDLDQLYSTWYKISVAVAVISVVHVLLALILLFSVCKRSPRGVCLWVYMMSALVVAAFVSVLALGMLRHPVSGAEGFTGTDIFLSFLEGLVFFGVMCYCILCVNSYYLMLKGAEDVQGPNKTCSEYSQ